MSERYPVYRTYGSDQSFQSQYDITPRPLRMEEEPDPSIGGWFNAVGDAIAMLPLYQSIYENTRVFEGDDPNYDPLSPSNLEGYEAFASEFIGIRSKERQDFLKKESITTLDAEPTLIVS